jgi:hypothetical protein
MVPALTKNMIKKKALSIQHITLMGAQGITSNEG